MKEKITHTATDLFLKLGVRSITMDDIAHELGISKKTIYEHFENKTELIKQCTISFVKTINKEIDSICSLNQNPIEEMFEIKNVVLEKLKKVKFSPHFQLQKYYPKISQTVQQAQYEQILSWSKNNLRRGVEAGLYRKEIHPEFISRLYYIGITGIRDREMFLSQDFSTTYISDSFLEYHLRGIVTPEGLSLLKNFIKENQLKDE